MKLSLNFVAALALFSSVLTFAAPLPQGWGVVKKLKGAKALFRDSESKIREQARIDVAEAEARTAAESARASSPAHSSEHHYRGSPAGSPARSEEEYSRAPTPPRQFQPGPSPQRGYGGPAAFYGQPPRQEPHVPMQYMGHTPPSHAASSHGAPPYVPYPAPQHGYHPGYPEHGGFHQPIMGAQARSPYGGTYRPEPGYAWQHQPSQDVSWGGQYSYPRDRKYKT